MRFLLVALFILSGKSALACNFQIMTENLLGLSAGTICASISNVRTDHRGPYRLLEYNVIDVNTGIQEFPPMPLRLGMSKSLKTTELIGVGTVSLMLLKVKSMNSATITFLNGNTLNLQIDEYGRAVPDQICVQQVGVNQLRGYEGRCP